MVWTELDDVLPLPSSCAVIIIALLICDMFYHILNIIAVHQIITELMLSTCFNHMNETWLFKVCSCFFALKNLKNLIKCMHMVQINLTSLTSYMHIIFMHITFWWNILFVWNPQWINIMIKWKYTLFIMICVSVVSYYSLYRERKRVLCVPSRNECITGSLCTVMTK